jgi:cysteinyl-tRNA synthetase
LANDLLIESGGVLNIFTRTPEAWYKALMAVKKIDITEDGIALKIQERQKARESKDWAAADGIRKELEEKGIILEDRKDGTGWKVKIS